MLLGVASGAWASNDWKSTNTSSDWFDGANWSGGVAPSLAVQTNTRTYQTNASTVMPIINSGNAENWQLEIGGGSHALGAPTGSITMNGGTMTIGDYFRIGASSTSCRWGEFYMNDGTWNVGGYMAVGYGNTASEVRGSMWMTGGTINVTGELRFNNGSTASGYAYISGGTINVSGLLNMKAGTAAHLDVSGDGKLVLAGDQRAALETAIDNGWVYSDGVQQSGYEMVSYDGSFTTLAVPEPATLCLLGLGALSLIRRK